MSVYRDEKRKTWYCKFSYKDIDGTRKQTMKRGFSKKKEALEFEREFLELHSMGKNMVFRALCSLYLEDRKVNSKESTWRNKRYRINKWLLPAFARRKVAEITPGDVRHFFNQLKQEKTENETPLSESYLSTLYSDLSAIFNFAVRYYGLNENPCQKAGGAGKKTRRIHFWTKEEFDRFIATFSHDSIYYIVFLILYYTGLRKGELQALTLADIDYAEGLIHVRKTYDGAAKGEKITPPKTEKSIRDVSLPPTLLITLKEFFMNRETDRNTLLFPTGKSTFAYHLNKHALIAGVSVIKVHEIRHSHASLLINLGCNILLVSERLGHSDIKMTLNVYGHLFPSKQKELADKLEKFLMA